MKKFTLLFILAILASQFNGFAQRGTIVNATPLITLTPEHNYAKPAVATG